MLLLSLLVGLKDGAEAPMGHHGQPFRQCFALAGGQAAWVATRRFWGWSPYRWPGPAQKQRRGGQRLQLRGCASHQEHYNPLHDSRDRKDETRVGLSPARCGDWTSWPNCGKTSNGCHGPRNSSASIGWIKTPANPNARTGWL